MYFKAKYYLEKSHEDLIVILKAPNKEKALKIVKEDYGDSDIMRIFGITDHNQWSVTPLKEGSNGIIYSGCHPISIRRF